MPLCRYTLYIESQAYASNLKHKLATGSLVVAPKLQAGTLGPPAAGAAPPAQPGQPGSWALGSALLTCS